MKRVFTGERRLVLAGVSLLLTVVAAVAAPAARAAPTAYAQPKNVGMPLNERFRGVNWERNGDNFTSSDLLQDGLTATDSYATVYLKATQILTSLQSNLHINTVRLGLNEATVADAWWTNYGAVVQAATDLGMNVDLSFWSPTNASGFPGSVVPCTDGTYTGCYPVSDYAPWWTMWQKVIDTYASYGNVYVQPYNEVAGYSDAATGYVGPSPTQLADLDAAWLAHYPDFPRGRVIFGGSGDDYYLTLGNDHRLDGTLLSYHPYCSFGLSFPSEAAWTRWLKGQVAGMESRTIITEFGLGEGSTNFDGPRNGNSCVSYVYAVTDYAHDSHLGLIYWDYGSTDSWSVATRTGSGTADAPYVTHIRNQSFVDRLEWGYGLNLPLKPAIGSAASATFYTGATSNSFALSTTGNPAASLSAGTLPAGVSLVDNGDGTGTLAGDPATLVPGVYNITLSTLNASGTASQNFVLTVTAGPPPAPTTGTIGGVVTDAAGHPLANVCAHVFVASTLPPYKGNNYAPAIYQACSAADGSYSIPLVTAGTGRYNVQFIDQNRTYQPQWYGDTSGPGTAAVMGYNHPGTAISVAANATTTVNASMSVMPSGVTADPTVTSTIDQQGHLAAAWAVSGTITVTNNNNVALTGVNVTDAVNDPNATCVVTGGTGVTIPASPAYPGPLVTATFPYTCTYSAAPAFVSETDTATATWDFNTNVPNASYQYSQAFTLPEPIGGVVPATLSLALGTPASFGSFVPGVGADYAASTTANVISTAGDATLSVSDPSSSATGHLVNGSFSLPQPLQAHAASAGGASAGAPAPVGSSASPLALLTYAGPVSNDAVTIDFKQSIGANDALRTGAYAKTLTFTLSTTSP